MDLQNKRIPDQEFYKIREEVLQQWPTGKAVNLDEAIAYHKSLPDKKVFSKKLIDAKNRGVTLIQPRAGVALIKDQIELLTYLQNKGEALLYRLDAPRRPCLLCATASIIACSCSPGRSGKSLRISSIVICVVMRSLLCFVRL